MNGMNFLITGGTGFIGTELCSMILREGHFVTIVTRSPERYESESARNQRFISWDSGLVEAMEEADVVINLAGESIFGQRWTPGVKKRIYDSRIETTRRLVETIRNVKDRPGILISVSGVHYYGDSSAQVLDENAPPGKGFLPEVCVDWEEAAKGVTELGVRLAVPRLAVVLGKRGGALRKMLIPFKLFVGGPVGGGDQFFPWIHKRDLCRGLLYPVENEKMQGAYNLAAPTAVTMNEFAGALGEVLNRPAFFRVPESVLNLALGEAAAPILDSLHVRPEKLQQAGFQFEFKTLREALADIL